MTRNPYELRMECLTMAENRLQNRFSEAQRRYEYLPDMGIEQDPQDYPIFPTDEEISSLADKLMSRMAGE